MKSKYKVVIGSLVGAVMIHATMVACSGSGDKSALSADDAVDGGFLDALLDALGLTDAVERDARASDDAGAAGCACGGATKTADTDVAQLRRFDVTMAATVNATSRVTDGPFVITDLNYAAATDQNVYLWVVPVGTTCTTTGDGVGKTALNGPLVLSTSTDGASHRVHTSVFVKPGESLCIQYDAVTASQTNANFRNASISGYVPY